MKIEGGLFVGSAVFFILVAGVYYWLSQDIIGGVCLLFTGFLSAIAGFYTRYTAKAVFPRPEDRLNGNIEEADPDYGFFSPHSWWPLALAFAIFVFTLGFIFAAWLAFFGTILIFLALTGWLFEYYYGDHAH